MATCEWCGEPATYRCNANRELVCEVCARYQHAFDMGASHTAGQILNAVMEVAGVSANELLVAAQRTVGGGDPMVGAEARDGDALSREREEGRDPMATSERWRHEYTLIEEVPS